MCTSQFDNELDQIGQLLSTSKDVRQNFDSQFSRQKSSNSQLDNEIQLLGNNIKELNKMADSLESHMEDEVGRMRRELDRVNKKYAEMKRVLEANAHETESKFV